MYLIKRNKTYHIYYTDPWGKQKTKSTKCQRKDEALLYLANFKTEVQQKQIAKRLLFEEYEKIYNKRAEVVYSPGYNESIKHAFKQFGRIARGLYLDEITPIHIEQFKVLKISEASEHIARGYMASLKSAFNQAKQLGYLSDNPFARVKMPRPPRNHPVDVNVEELQKICAAERNPLLKILYQFSFYSGARLSEATNMKWSHIDFINNSIQIKNSDDYKVKSKRQRDVPLHPYLKKLLNGMTRTDEYVFTGMNLKRRRISQKFKEAVIKSGVNPLIHTHSLRHGFATELHRRGVDLYIISKLLGHHSIAMTEIYSHVRNESKVMAVNILPAVE
jgi:integrase